jgi:hypothetical protein
MIRDANYRSTMGQITKSSTYDIIETIDPIAAAVQHVTSNYVEQIALVAITLHFENRANSDPACSPLKVSTPYLPGQTKREDHSGQERGFLRGLVEHLRTSVRKTDGVFLLNQTSYFLLPGANQQGAQIVQGRLWEAMLWHINHSEVVDARALRAYNITIGHSAYPVPYGDIGEFIKGASKVVLRFELQLERFTRKVVRSHQSSRQDATSRVEAPAKATLAASIQNDALEQQDGGASEELAILARKIGIPYLALLPKKLPEDLQQLVNPQLARELHCYPLGRERNMLTVAMLNPQDSSALDRLQRETGLHIFPVLTHPDALQTALEQLAC